MIKGICYGYVVQTPAVDCTVAYSRLYSLFQSSVQSTAGVCIRWLEEKA